METWWYGLDAQYPATHALYCCQNFSARSIVNPRHISGGGVDLWKKSVTRDCCCILHANIRADFLCFADWARFGQNVMGRHSPSLVTWWWSPRRGWHSTLVSWASIHKTFPCFNPSFTKFANFFRSRQGRRSELAYLFASTVGYVCIHVPRSLYSERFMNALCSRPSLGKESPLVWSKSSGYRAVIDLATTPCSVHHLESFTILKGWQVPYVMAAGTMILSRVLLRCFRHALNPADEAHFRE